MPRTRAREILRDLSVAHRCVPGLVRTQIRTVQTAGVGASRRVYRKGDRSLDETVIEWEDGHGFLLRLDFAHTAGPSLPPTDVVGYLNTADWPRFSTGIVYPRSCRHA
jgi:hypothetical protein